MGALTTAAIFTDHMVIQMGKPIVIWGHDYSGRKITASFCGYTADTLCIDNRWQITFPPVNTYGGPYELTLTDGSESLTISDIMIGEVWIAGGQSNMELELQNECHAEAELAACENSGVRFYYTKKNPYIDEFFYIDEKNGGWALPSAENSRCWSAVGYYFGKKLASDLGVTVGIIGCNWGGTSASNWIDRKNLVRDEDTRTYVDEYDKAMEGKSFEDYLKELREYREWEAEWQPKINEFYQNNPEGSWDEAQEYAGSPSRWPEPLGPKSPFRAGGLYETMLKRIAPYSAKGFIYYQGESDDHKPQMYEKLLKMLISQWRTDWNDPEMPFIMVQLPMFINRGEEDRKNWCLIREAQMNTHLTTANTGIAVTLDCGEYGNIHPVNKIPVGERLEKQAMCHVYGKLSPAEAYGPVYYRSYPEEDCFILEFKYASDGFDLRNEDTPSGFEVAGDDKEYHNAAAQILSGGKIRLTSPEVKEPKFARFKWTNYAEVTLFGKNGIPVAPFRTSPEA
ncbi:MAG: sialate O-acetylesterase [Huintestinicola sp.]|uniref:sialate O-acetylesterase n=1 Tax=Huintestinicola sp. TaxID=2981661 RepID=UPI003F0ED460